MKIEYIEGNTELLGLVKPLWEKTRDYHSSISTYFSDKFARQYFELRERDFSQKSEEGQLQIIVARDKENKKDIGYCVSVIDKEKVGEIESIFVEPEYRNKGIANNFMSRTLAWMKDNEVRSKRLSIAVGNETVIDFYRRYSFYPYQVILEEKENK